MRNAAVLILMGLLMLAWFLAAKKSAPVPRPAPLTHEIYIWQQQWTPPLREAVATAKPACAGFVPLAARIAWHEAEPTVTWPEVSWQEVADGSRHSAAAIRVEPLAGTAAAQPAAREAVTTTALECIRRATAQGVEIREIQLDFDAAESQLGIYADWLRRLRESIAPRRVAFTALPCWLDQATFKELASVANGYVLQVHAAEKPTPETSQLCDEEKARMWVARAAQVAPGVPFRVALPTYTYEFAFAPDTTCLGVVAEGENREWPVDSQVVVLGADPAAMVRLRDAWNTARPAELTGVLWYRLPIATDVRNWRWVTLATVIRGGIPHAELIVRPKLDAERKLCDLTLENTGDADAQSPSMVSVVWDGTTCESGDPVSGYSLTTGPVTAVFHLRGETPGDAGRIVRPGQSVALGWLRFTDPVALPALGFSVK